MKFRLALAACLCALIAVGCSGSGKKGINVSGGEYYSEDEYDALSNKAKERYCSALSTELSGLNKDVEAKQKELDTTEEQIEHLKNELGPVERELLRTESDIRTLESQVEQFESLPKKWVIQPGECLWIIAGYEDIYADPVKWPRLYRGNMNIIEDPEWIWPDTVLTVPRDWPRQYTVKPEEYLSLIAGYWEVYGNPMDWPKLFEANKDKIRNPNWIEPNQVLTIPR